MILLDLMRPLLGRSFFVQVVLQANLSKGMK